tara:strand:- start:22 stop:387 length:366 start_codon:yes stop_codon:yes gene_type:complete
MKNNYKKTVLNHYQCRYDSDIKAYAGYDNTYEVMYTADSYDIFVKMPNASWDNVEPDYCIFYYSEGLLEDIRQDVLDGNYIYVDQTIQDELYMTEIDDEFWRDMYMEIEDEAQLIVEPNEA